MPNCPRCGLSYTPADKRCSRCGGELPVIEPVLEPVETGPALRPAKEVAAHVPERDQIDRAGFVGDYAILAELPTIKGFGTTQIVQKDGQKYLLKHLVLLQASDQLSYYCEVFQEECRFLQRLVHYGLPSVVEFCAQDAEFHLLLTYSEGTSLLGQIYPNAKPGDLTTLGEPELSSLDRVAHWARQLADILLLLHTQIPFPVLHRNLSPDAVIITRAGGDVRLIDFGLLRSFEAILSDTHQVPPLEFGPFADPVLTSPQDANVRSDVFSYGRILDFLLTGIVPASREAPPAVATSSNYATSDPRFQELANVAIRCCQPSPEDRYENRAAIVEDLTELDRGTAMADTEEIQCVCGHSNRPSARFCNLCGRPLHVQDTDDSMTAVPIEITYDEDAHNELLASYQQSQFARLNHFRLREMLDETQSDPGFDTLLCLDALPQVSRDLPHQQEAALRVLKQMRGRALLADEVGLGKTIEAGIVLKELLQRQLIENILVFCPVQLLGQWQSELYDKFDELFLVVGRNIDTTLAWYCPRLIAPYRITEHRFHAEEMLAHQYDLVILDEAHHLNEPHNWKALRTIQNLRKKYFLLLSATPMHNDLRELYNIVTLLRPGHFEDWERFKERFVDERLRVAKGDFRDKKLVARLLEGGILINDEEDHNYAYFGSDIRGDLQLEERLERIRDDSEIEMAPVLEVWEQSQRSPARPKNTVVLRDFLHQVMVRNIRSEVAKDYPFPKRKAHLYELEMSPKATEFYSCFRASYQQGLKNVRNRRLLYEMGELVERLCSSPAAFREAVRHLRRRTKRRLLKGFVKELGQFAADYPHELVEPKIRTALDLAQQYVANGHKVLIFSQFNETACHVYREACQTDLAQSCFLYDELAHHQEKAQSLREFFKARAGVLFCPGEASEGLNLQYASVMINLDLPWDPMKIEQRIGRIQRIGGHEEVVIINLVLGGTIEEQIIKILEQKIHMFESVIGKVEEIIGNLSDADDFRAMICNLYLDREEEDQDGEVLAPQDRIDKALDEAIERSSSQESENILTSIFLDFSDEEDDEW